MFRWLLINYISYCFIFAACSLFLLWNIFKATSRISKIILIISNDVKYMEKLEFWDTKSEIINSVTTLKIYWPISIKFKHAYSLCPSNSTLWWEIYLYCIHIISISSGYLHKNRLISAKEFLYMILFIIVSTWKKIHSSIKCIIY